MNPFALPASSAFLWRSAAPAPEDLPLAMAQAWLSRGAVLRPPVMGTVLGVLLNDQRALDAMGESAHQPPYGAPPSTPVLYIKPRNTLSGHGAAIAVPADAPGLRIGAALGAVIGQVACRVREKTALSFVAGYTIVNDLTIPHDNFHRPALPARIRDGTCAVGPWIRSPDALQDPDDTSIIVSVDGTICQQASTATFVRPLARLLHEITAYMTLHPGDILLTGIPADAPTAEAGQAVTIEIPGLGILENHLVREDLSSQGTDR